MTMTEAARQLHRDMVDGAARLKREIGYNPTRFMQMVGELGAADGCCKGGMHQMGSQRCGNTIASR